MELRWSKYQLTLVDGALRIADAADSEDWLMISARKGEQFQSLQRHGSDVLLWSDQDVAFLLTLGIDGQPNLILADDVYD